ncbi:uncharacterized protein LOC134800502 [Cydia splendana]|uniref:uncharacterized protein LOC134800502 n=1 Tax=Cydia splendana TaxID=1100963 RepID=UPI00300CF8D5
MPFKYWPDFETCCVCIKSLRTATAIIATLALVSNPLLSWLMIRHSYAVRVACLLSGASRMDVVDVNINNVISFGFGMNADLGISCLAQSQDEGGVSNQVIKALGWIMLISDVVFLITSMLLLMRIYRFQNPTRRVTIAFIISGLIALVLSSIYGIMYVTICAFRGKGIALCQLALTFVDLGSKKYKPKHDLYFVKSTWGASKTAAERRAAGAEASDVVRRARRDWAGGPRPGTTAWISARRLPARADTAVTLRRVGP